MTIEPTPTLSAHDARLLTQRIQLVAGNAREALEKLHVLVEQARSGGAHAALGFASWTDYLSSTLGASPMRLDREQRRELVSYLAGEGMSTRAIAPIVGVHHDTVASDIKESAPVGFPTAARPVAPKPIRGRDGKTYVRPEPKPDRAAQAVESYPELQHYRDKGDDQQAARIASALDGMDEPERERRREVLAKHIDADKRGALTPEPDPIAGLREDADRVFLAANTATRALRQYGDAIAAAIPHEDALTVRTWRDEFRDLAAVCTHLAAACEPQGLRVVK